MRQILHKTRSKSKSYVPIKLLIAQIVYNAIWILFAKNHENRDITFLRIWKNVVSYVECTKNSFCPYPMNGSCASVPPVTHGQVSRLLLAWQNRKEIFKAVEVCDSLFYSLNLFRHKYSCMILMKPFYSKKYKLISPEISSSSRSSYGHRYKILMRDLLPLITRNEDCDDNI